MTSPTPGPCCFTGFKHDGTPAGKISKIKSIDTYFAYPKDNRTPTKAVLIIPDVFGIMINSQLLTDDFAKNGYLAVLPDILAGDAMELGAFEAGKIDIPAWVSRHGPDAVDPIIREVIKYMREHLGVTKIAGAGYCFGGKYVARFLKDGHLDTGYSGHPSFVSEEELLGIEKPFSISAAEIDSIFTTENRQESEKLLAKIGQPWQINLFSGVSHGYTIRGDLSVPINKYAKEQAFLQALAWFEWTL